MDNKLNNDINDEKVSENDTQPEPATEQLSPNNDGEHEQVKPKTKKQLFLQLVIFTAFMASAGVIQFVATSALSTWTGLIPEPLAYIIGTVLSVIWSFTFNRKFTFKAASNIPLAMGLVTLYYIPLIALSYFGANAIIDAWQNAAGDGWDQNYEMVITIAMMLINFVTEFIWEKFVVFNDKVMAKIERKLHIKHKEKSAEQTEQTETTETVTEEIAETTAPEEVQTENENQPEQTPEESSGQAEAQESTEE